jgi:putative transposase
VKLLKAFRYELRPTGEQQCLMSRFAGCARFVFNRALAIQNQERLLTGRKLSGYAALCRMLTAWRNDPQMAWLSETPVHTGQQALWNLESAWSRHFESLKKLKRGEIKPEEVVGPPKFKKKHSARGFRFPDAKQFRLEQHNNRLFLPKLGWIRYRNSRAVEGEVSNITVFREGLKWFVSLQTEREAGKPVHPSGSIVGIDLGVARFATLSNGEVIEPVNSLKKNLALLARCQRMMARRVRRSQNWKKAKARVDGLHRKIANIRNDFLHKSTTAISKNHAVAVIEDLKVRNMSKSAAGTKDNPGRNVKQKSGLNRAILDQGWTEFRRQLGYKQEWRGGRLLAVPAPYSSQECPGCGHVSAANRPAQALFLCVRCGFKANADLVASINIERAGHARLACEVNGAVMAVSSRNPPRGGAAMRRPVGISGLQAGEDVKIVISIARSSPSELGDF